MSAEHQAMSLQRIIHHVADKTLEFVLESDEPPPPPPAWLRKDLIYGGGTRGETVSFTVPVGKKIALGPPVLVAVVGQDAAGKDIYIKYTWDAATQTWVDNGRVDPATWQPL